MIQRSRASTWIRSNVWAVAICFAAVTGTAVAGGSGPGQSSEPATVAAGKQFKKLKRSVRALKRRVAAVEAGPSGPAGGELSGTYPNPSIGTVSGLDLAPSTSPAGGINFGGTANLYRSAPNTIRTGNLFRSDGGLLTNGQLIVGGSVALGSGLDQSIIANGWLTLNTLNGAPAIDPHCDDDLDYGRVTFDTVNHRLWICDDNTGWRFVATSQGP